MQGCQSALLWTLFFMFLLYFFISINVTQHDKQPPAVELEEEEEEKEEEEKEEEDIERKDRKSVV